MPPTVRWLAALVCAGALAPVAHAQPNRPVSPYPLHPPYIAPDACGPGWYCYCPDGTTIGPNYCLRPPFAPFNGMLPQMQRAQGSRGSQGQLTPIAPTFPRPAAGAQAQQMPMVVFPTHPYARSPRDFFMWGEAQQDLHTRERPPAFVP